MKDPAFLFYPNDWIGGTMGMTFEQKGAYMELLMLQFNRGHMTKHMIGHVLGQNSDYLWESVKDKFEIDDEGQFFNPRLDIEINKRKAYSESRRNNITGKNQYKKHPEIAQQQQEHMSGHMTSHMENENDNIILSSLEKDIDKEKGIQGEKEKEKEKEEEKPLWKTDFQFYLSELRVAYNQLIRDPVWIAEKQKYYPGLNIQLSLEKACVEYWATEAGWKNKKASRTKIIDWKATLTNALSLKSNKVYESKPTANNNRKELENLRDLSERVLQGFAGHNNS